MLVIWCNVIGGIWKDTVGVIQSINEAKQSVTINVELFGRETPVEISFTESSENVDEVIRHFADG